MAKVMKMVNISEVTVSVLVDENVMVQVPPQGTLENVEVHNLPQVRKYFKVVEDLTEPVRKKGKGILNG